MHSSQFRTRFSNSVFSQGQYTVSLALNLHLLSPKWLLCNCFSMACCCLLGITILVPFNMRPSSMVSSFLKVQYGCSSGGTCLIFLGHPCMMVCFSMASSSLACVATLNCCKVSLLAGNCLVIWFTCSLGSLMASFWSPKWDKQSASWFVVPGIYLTVNV